MKSNKSNNQFVYWKREKKNDSWKIAKVDEIPELIKKNGAMFATWASFDKPPMDNERDDIEAFSVTRFGDLPLDFDAKGDIEKARKGVLAVTEVLTKNFNVNVNELQFFISGGKGFHLVISREIICSENGDKFLPLIYKSMVNEMFPEGDERFSCIDRSLYCMKRGKMFRLPNVQREGSGKYKIPVTFEEISSLNGDELMELADTPRPKFAGVEPPTKNAGLMELFFRTGRGVLELISRQKRIPKRKPSRKVGTLLPCTKRILAMTEKNSSMSFNEMCFSAIVPSLREVGIAHEIMLASPDVENFLANFEGSEAYTDYNARYNHLKSVITRDKSTPAGFSCGSMRKCLGDSNDACVGCPYLITSFFFDAFEDVSPVGSTGDDADGPSDENPTLNKLLQEYSWSRIGTKEVVIRETNDVDDDDDVQMLSKATFEGLVNNLPEVPYIAPDGKIKYRKPSDAWYRCPKRRSYVNGVKFSPGKVATPGYYNLWKGFPIEAEDMELKDAAEGCKLFRYHVEEVLCKGNKEHSTFLWAWLADLIRNPGGRKPGSAIVLKGGKGTGKSTLAYPFSKILGQYCATMSNSTHAFARFNGHLENKLLVVLEEAVWGGSHEADSALKSMITETSMTIEHKGFPAYTAKTYMRVMMCSNEDWVIPASGDERRFFVVDTGTEKKDSKYFDRLYYEIDHGGAEALFVWLKKADIPEVNLYNPPKTEGLDDQKLVGLGSAGEWWLSVLQNGRFETGYNGNTLVDWKELVSASELYGYYAEWCRRFGRKYMDSQMLMSRKIVGKTGLCPSRRTTVFENGRPVNVYRVGSLERARESFCTAMKLSSELDWDLDFKGLNLDV